MFSHLVARRRALEPGLHVLQLQRLVFQFSLAALPILQKEKKTFLERKRLELEDLGIIQIIFSASRVKCVDNLMIIMIDIFLGGAAARRWRVAPGRGPG